MRDGTTLYLLLVSLTATGLAVAAAGVAIAVKAFSAPPPPAVISVTSRPLSTATTESPTTATVFASREMRDRLASLDEFKSSDLRIAVLGARASNTTVFVRVFLNDRKANAGTKTDTDHYVGSFAFYTRAGQPSSYLMDITLAARRLKKSGKFGPEKPIRITLVPVDRKGGEASVEFDRVRIEVAR